MHKTIKFITLGCKANQYDTQSIRESFLKRGFKESADGFPSDVYLINTCTVTQKADRDSLYFIRHSHHQNPKGRIIVTGCLAELDAQLICREPGVSVVVKNKDKDKIFGLQGISSFSGHTRAFLKIQDGCDNFCSYCKVPLVRGHCRSKPLPEILEEAERLARNGFKELVLTGICLGAYGKDLGPRIELLAVLESLEKIEAVQRLRLSSIEVNDTTDELIGKLKESKKICRHLHIPLQSGDTEILKKMRRKYTQEEYLQSIKRIKNLIPEIAITTDVLVGFPGEEERHFKNTTDLIKEILPLKVHIFPYSERKGTFAADNFPQRVASAIVKQRIAELKTIAEKCALLYKKQFLNQKMEVLIEEPVTARPGFCWGYTDNYLKTLVRANEDLQNKIITVKLKKIKGELIEGEYFP